MTKRKDPPPEPSIGYQRCLEVVNKIRNKKIVTSNNNAITANPWWETATLDQLLKVEKDFLAWYKTTDSDQKEEKNHIYTSYIKPRILILSGSGVQETLMP